MDPRSWMLVWIMSHAVAVAAVSWVVGALVHPSLAPACAVLGAWIGVELAAKRFWG